MELLGMITKQCHMSNDDGLDGDDPFALPHVTCCDSNQQQGRLAEPRSSRSTMKNNFSVINRNNLLYVISLVLVFQLCRAQALDMDEEERLRLREDVRSMFYHTYDAYMQHAYPADELMPLSCKGRFRTVEQNRGTLDDALGNFSLTLVDTLDTLVILNNLTEFEDRTKDLIRDLNFDVDVVVSTFETNIRMVGGLLSSHILIIRLQRDRPDFMPWYNNELLDLAKDLAYRILPAFNTASGVPHPLINLKYGLNSAKVLAVNETCTACAGTMILEFAVLSRLTGDPIFEEKAHKAMDVLWEKRHHNSDLVGSILDINSAQWIRKESGVGAGIDSYYEYLLKAYVLLGNETYLYRFNRHYTGIMKYISQGPLLVDVHMHRPNSAAKNYMDSLLAFWPGLQVLMGDIKPAIQTHEILYQVMKQHNFLPEAFTTDFNIYWGHHPLRPEFIESTYFLFQATGDKYYLDVGRRLINMLNRYAKVPCGFAALSDVRTVSREDRLDSFFLSETLKYLYLLFSTKSELPLNLDEFVFSTEAHFFPVDLSSYVDKKLHHIKDRIVKSSRYNESDLATGKSHWTYKDSYLKSDYEESNHFLDKCPTSDILVTSTQRQSIPLASIDTARRLRHQLKDFVVQVNDNSNRYQNSFRHIGLGVGTVIEEVDRGSGFSTSTLPRISAQEFSTTNQRHLEVVKLMGIKVLVMSDGKIQLLHNPVLAATPQLAEEGAHFMQDMVKLSQQTRKYVNMSQLRMVSYTDNDDGKITLIGGPAQFGVDLSTLTEPFEGSVLLAEPFNACDWPLRNSEKLNGKIAIIRRGDCMFVEKARNVQRANAIGAIILDNIRESTIASSNMFAMSGDGKDDITIPLVFIFGRDAKRLIDDYRKHPKMIVSLGVSSAPEFESSNDEDEFSASDTQPDQQSSLDTVSSPETDTDLLDMDDILGSLESGKLLDSIQDLFNFASQLTSQEEAPRVSDDKKKIAKKLSIHSLSETIAEKLSSSAGKNMLSDDKLVDSLSYQLETMLDMIPMLMRVVNTYLDHVKSHGYDEELIEETLSAMHKGSLQGIEMVFGRNSQISSMLQPFMNQLFSSLDSVRELTDSIPAITQMLRSQLTYYKSRQAIQRQDMSPSCPNPYMSTPDHFLRYIIQH